MKLAYKILLLVSGLVLVSAIACLFFVVMSFQAPLALRVLILATVIVAFLFWATAIFGLWREVGGKKTRSTHLEEGEFHEDQNV